MRQPTRIAFGLTRADAACRARDDPATPTNIPYIGRTKVGGLWVNAGHGTLGWTHGAGSGKAMAELIGGRQPRMNFRFYGFEQPERGYRGEGELSLR